MHLEDSKIIKYGLKTVFYALLGIILLLVVSDIAAAQSTIGNEWDQFLNDLPSFQAEEDEPGEDLAISFIRNAIIIVRNILGGAALITGSVYGAMLVLARGKEESITKGKKNFVYALMGFVILIAAEGVSNVLNPENATSQALIDFDAGRDQLRDIINYVTWIIGSVIFLFMALIGVRMIGAGSNQEIIEKQRKGLTWSLMGILVILLSRNIVNAIYVLNAPDQISPGSSENAINQIAGVVRLVLVFLGPAAVAFTLYAGFLYLISLDKDESIQKAKRMLITGIVSIVIIYSAFALVSTITTENFDPNTEIQNPSEEAGE